MVQLQAAQLMALLAEPRQVVCLLAPVLSQAKITISRKIPFEVTALASLESNIQKASERPVDETDSPLGFEVDTNNKLYLSCPPHLPDKNGLGCKLLWSISLPDGATLLISKKLAVNRKSKEVQDRLVGLNPNDLIDQ